MRRRAIMAMEKPAGGRMRRMHNAAVGYHLLVGLVFTAYLPVTLASSFGARPAGSAGPFATALDTARDAAAQAFSLPG